MAVVNLNSSNQDLTDIAPRRLRNSGGLWFIREISQAEWPSSLWFSLAFSLIIGFLYAAVLLGPSHLNPSNVSWMHEDPATYYIGWALFFGKTHIFIGRLGIPTG